MGSSIRTVYFFGEVDDAEAVKLLNKHTKVSKYQGGQSPYSVGFELIKLSEPDKK